MWQGSHVCRTPFDWAQDRLRYAASRSFAATQDAFRLRLMRPPPLDGEGLRWARGSQGGEFTLPQPLPSREGSQEGAGSNRAV